MARERDPVLESSWEVDQARRLAAEPAALKQFWDSRFVDLYGSILDEISEFGRHGVIAEYAQRIRSSGEILDIGCGTAPLLEVLDHSRFRYTGLDVSKHALELAQARRGRFSATFVCCPLEEFEPKRGFDVIILNEVLYYLDPKRDLRRALAWLKEEGIVIISAFAFPEGDEAIRIARSLIEVADETIVDKRKRGLRWTVIVGRPA